LGFSVFFIGARSRQLKMPVTTSGEAIRAASRGLYRDKLRIAGSRASAFCDDGLVTMERVRLGPRQLAAAIRQESN
jgi:hypothetical protein